LIYEIFYGTSYLFFAVITLLILLYNNITDKKHLALTCLSIIGILYFKEFTPFINHEENESSKNLLYLIAFAFVLINLIRSKSSMIFRVGTIAIMPVAHKFVYSNNLFESLFFFVSLKLMLWGISENNRDTRDLLIRRYKADFISVILFFGSLIFFTMSTNGTEIYDVDVNNYTLYSVSMFFLLLLMLVHARVALFSSLTSFVKNSKEDGFVLDLFFSFFIFLSKFIFLFNVLLYEAEPVFQNSCIVFLKVFIPLSVVYHYLTSLTKSDLKSFIMSVLYSQVNIAVLGIVVTKSNSLYQEINFYLLGAILPVVVISGVLDRYKNPKGQIIKGSMKGLYYKDKVPSALFIIAIMSLIGIPITLGFSSRFFLLVNYIQEKLTIQVALILFGSLLILPKSIGILGNLFNKNFDEEIGFYSKISTRGKIIYLLLGISILILGIYPKLLV
jgi:succinate dehydrogenase hydrophobic anchor subunit